MTAIGLARHVDQPEAQVAAAVRHLEILAETITEECCQQVEATLVLCREERVRRAYADEFFAAAHAQAGELRTLLLCAAIDQHGVDSVSAQ